MTIYDDGRLYDWLTLALTGGRNVRLKARLMAQLGIYDGAAVLDWGCGTGAGLKLLARQQFRGVYHGIEIHAGMLRRALPRVPRNGDITCHFVLRHGFGVTLAEPADFAFAFHSLGVLPPDRFVDGIEEIWRNLKPHARLLLTDMCEPRPQAEQRGNIHGRMGTWVARRIFGQDFSGKLLPTVERYFEPLSYEQEPGTLAFAFCGQRRATPLVEA